MSETCFHCGAPATRWCDFVIARELGGHEWIGKKPPVFPSRQSPLWSPRIHLDGESLTCDCPLCDDCGRHLGSTFFDGPEDRFIESVDHCGNHAGTDDSGALIVSREDADRIRDRIWTQRLKVVGFSDA